MGKRKCDLCGSPFEIEDERINCMSIFYKNHMNNYRQFESFNLCPYCAEEIQTTISNLKPKPALLIKKLNLPEAALDPKNISDYIEQEIDAQIYRRKRGLR